MDLGNNAHTDTTWEIYEDEFRSDQVVTTGSNYMIGNGYCGYRGTFADDTRAEYVACVLTDTYDNADGVWKELATVPNGLYTTLMVNGTPLRWSGADTQQYRRTLNFRYGEWSGEATWKKRGISVAETRFASAEDIHLLTSRTTITAHRSAEMTIVTGIDADIWSLNGNHFRALRGDIREGISEIVGVTQEHGYEIVVQEHATLTGPAGEPVPHTDEHLTDHDGGSQLRRLECSLDRGQSIVLTKYVALYSTNDLRRGQNPHTVVHVPALPAETGTLDPARSAARFRKEQPPVNDLNKPTEAELRTAATAVIHEAQQRGWETVRRRHRERWDRWWEHSDIEIAGDDRAATVLRYNIYHNIIATPVHTDHLPIGARGLSCQAYQGAAFWDQEIFNLPMFIFTAPDVARNILVYRYRTLDGARRKARDLGYHGAFYPWISGDSGEEICPAYFFRDVISGRKIRNHFNDWQIHISPDISYTISRYVAITGDEEFLKWYGGEIVFEVARFLYSRSLYRPDRDRYEIIRVLGPDEYHENVDNNFFTNYQARFALAYGAEVFDWLGERDPEALKAVSGKIKLDAGEVERWRQTAEKMYVPEPSKTTGLIEQFSGYFQYEDITPRELKERLIEGGEYWGWPNGIALETQVTKQADVTQLFMLHPEAYTREIMQKNWEYYEKRTQHGSSLSPAVYAIVAAWIGRLDDAYRYFMKSCTIDLYNDNKAVSGGTFIGGIHTAACGVAWQIVVHGFAGMSVSDDGISFAPRLPAEWERVTFPLEFRKAKLSVEITTSADGLTTTSVTAGKENSATIEVTIDDETVHIRPGETVKHDGPSLPSR